MELHSIYRRLNIILSLFLVQLILLLCFGACSSQSVPADFIMQKCNATEFPHLCVTSLASYAAFIGDSTMRMADAALNVSLRAARSTSATMAKMSTEGRMGPREAEAVRDCVEVLADAAGLLRDSLRRMGRARGGDFGARIEDVQTWVSAALTDDGTCMDGFERRAAAEREVRSRVVTLARLTSNALALINGLAPAAE